MYVLSRRDQAKEQLAIGLLCVETTDLYKNVAIWHKIQLPEINQATLSQWYIKRQKTKEQHILKQGLP